MPIPVSFRKRLHQVRVSAGETDKHQHFTVSLALAALAMHTPVAAPAAVIATLAVGLAKEAWDHYLGSGFCWLDMTANALGATSGAALVVLLRTGLSG
ncbi:hypothetical protein ACMDCT_12830 [Halomonadaceae bacterium KBTZ08]